MAEDRHKSASFSVSAEPGDRPGDVVIVIDDVDSVERLTMPEREAGRVAAEILVAMGRGTGKHVASSDDRVPARLRVTSRGRA
jgi:hypothetical protein